MRDSFDFDKLILKAPNFFRCAPAFGGPACGKQDFCAITQADIGVVPRASLCGSFLSNTC